MQLTCCLLKTLTVSSGRLTVKLRWHQQGRAPLRACIAVCMTTKEAFTAKQQQPQQQAPMTHLCLALNAPESILQKSRQAWAALAQHILYRAAPRCTAGCCQPPCQHLCSCLPACTRSLVKVCIGL